MRANQFEYDIRQLAELAKQIKPTSEQSNHPLVLVYLNQLNNLIKNGWQYALGSENEIDKELLPENYLLQRMRVIQNLQLKLGECAIQYRSTLENSSASHKAIEEYNRIYCELIRISGEILALDPDTELPDELMPTEYVQFWLTDR